MKISNYIILALSLLLISTASPMLGQNKSIPKEINIFKTFTNQDSLDISSISTITGLKINGKVCIKNTEDFFVRILLTDISDNQYLVYENYPEICSTNEEELSGIGTETMCLNNVTTKNLKIYIKNAELRIQNIIIDDNIQPFNILSSDFVSKSDSIRLLQVKKTVVAINSYNKKNGKTWIAGVTPLALMTYQQRKHYLGLPDNVSSQGIEYYIDGIFILRDLLNTSNTVDIKSDFVSNFDWRNRHGVNWITPVKDQGQSSYCTAFAAVSCVEAITNLYFNQHINLDLSEQEAACCNKDVANRNPYTEGMTISAPLEYIRDNGVCDEASYPFIDADSAHYCKSDEITPAINVQINGFNLIYPKTAENIKKAIITKGPLVSGFYFGFRWDKDNYISRSHAMALIGWRVLQVGDTINHLYNRGKGTDLSACKVIAPNDSLIGKTVWIFKNSYKDRGEDIMSPEYMYIVFDNIEYLHTPYSIELPIRVSNIEDNSIICEDKDGDGYYNWGIGPKPTSCPSWVPDEEDGDDSNPNYGPMNEFGHLQIISPDKCEPLHIVQSVNYVSDQHFWQNVIIDPFVQLSISGNLYFHNGAKLIVSNNASLRLVNNAVIHEATLDIAKNATIEINDNAEIRLKQEKKFSIPKGSRFTFNGGTIKK